jgi:predicted nucleotidyltransferase
MPTTRQLAIPIPHEAVAEFCRKWGIRRLSFFGSVTRDDFDPERSDVDVLVEFQPGRTPGWEYYYTIPNELSEIVGRKVDMRTPRELSPNALPCVREDLTEEYVEVR